MAPPSLIATQYRPYSPSSIVDTVPTYRAAIFDLDGTLVDSTTTLVNAANYALSVLGHSTYTLEEIRPMLGGGTRKLMERALTRALGYVPDAVMLDTACRLKLEFENSPAGQNAKVPFPGAHAMLRALQAAGVQLGVLSNTAEPNVQKLVAKHFGDIAFAHVAGARDDTPLKPNPFAATRISKERMVDITPENCVFIGDSEFDMKTAKAAGMMPLAVPWGIREAEMLVEHGAALVVEKMQDITRFIVDYKL